MKIAVTGGTGTLGRQVAAELRSRGHEVRVLSRSAQEYRIDLTTGEGLGYALNGCEVVIDASNNPSSKGASQTLVEGSRRLLAAEEAAGVRHHVCVSVIGCDQVPIGYFRVKADQEQVVEQGPVAWSIVRATQFHEYVVTMLDAVRRWPVLPVPRMPVQTVASTEVARVVADVAVGPPLQGRVLVAGPEISGTRELVAAWLSSTGRRALLLPLPLPGKLGRALRAGALTARRPDVRGATPFTAWLSAQGG